MLFFGPNKAFRPIGYFRPGLRCPFGISDHQFITKYVSLYTEPRYLSSSPKAWRLLLVLAGSQLAHLALTFLWRSLHEILFNNHRLLKSEDLPGDYDATVQAQGVRHGCEMPTSAPPFLQRFRLTTLHFHSKQHVTLFDTGVSVKQCTNSVIRARECPSVWKQ